MRGDENGVRRVVEDDQKTTRPGSSPKAPSPQRNGPPSNGNSNNVMYRSKVLVVPYVRNSTGPEGSLFLLVKDRKFDEWTFISGTCKKRNMEHPLACATRELREETKDAIDIDLTTWPYRHVAFNTSYYEPSPQQLRNNTDISTTYHVYFLDISTYPRSPSQIVEEFTQVKKIGKQYNENIDIGFFLLKDLHTVKLWKFISHIVLTNVTLKSIIDAL